MPCRPGCAPPSVTDVFYPVGVASLVVVEDDEEIGRLLESGLEADGHQVRRYRTGRGAVAEAAACPADLVVLDLGLPDMDGLDVCRELRAAAPNTVIVILTARDEEMDVVSGLASGADDYLTKPFRHTELLARIRAHLRRSAALADTETPQRLTLAALEIDQGSRKARLNGMEVELRPKEFDLLWRLAQDVGIALTRETLMCDVWDEHWFGPTKTLDVHMAALRRKLAAAAVAAGAAPDALPRITTLRGHGYRLERSPRG
jgi:DNA-binding response OmpR family regulator